MKKALSSFLDFMSDLEKKFDMNVPPPARARGARTAKRPKPKLSRTALRNMGFGVVSGKGGWVVTRDGLVLYHRNGKRAVKPTEAEAWDYAAYRAASV